MQTHIVHVTIAGVQYIVSINGPRHNGQDAVRRWPALINNHCTDYFGNGNWNGRYWCIGIEPAIRGTDGALLNVAPPAPPQYDLLSKCIGSVLTTGFLLNNGLTDGREYQRVFNGNEDVFGKHQPTWDTFITVILGQQYPVEQVAPYTAVGDYRRQRFILPNDESLWIDLLPLPSHDTEPGNWEYTALGIPGLVSRPAYVTEYQGQRRTAIRTKVLTHKPRLALFLGMGMKEDAKAIANPVALQEYRWRSNRRNRILCADLRTDDQITKLCVAPQKHNGSPPDLFYHHLSHFLFLGAPLFI